MFTSQADRDSRITALQAGANDFLGKPVDSIEASWQTELDEFRKMSREYWLYQ